MKLRQLLAKLLNANFKVTNQRLNDWLYLHAKTVCFEMTDTSLDPRVVNTLNQQTTRIAELVQQVSVLQYILTQTLTIALRQAPNNRELLRDLQVLFAEKAAKGGIVAGSGDKGFELAEGIFTSVSASLD